MYTNKYISISSLNEAMVHSAPDEIQYFICIFFGSFFPSFCVGGIKSATMMMMMACVLHSGEKDISRWNKYSTYRPISDGSFFFFSFFCVVLLIFLHCHEGIWCMKSYVAMIEGASPHFNWLTIRLICDKNNRRMGTQDKGKEMGQTFVSDGLLVKIIIWSRFNRCHHHGYFFRIPSPTMPPHQLAKVKVLSPSDIVQSFHLLFCFAMSILFT